MGLRSFRHTETDRVATLPNAISVFRGVGGIALGVGLATGGIDPASAAISAAVLTASDAEGSLISLTNHYPIIQQRLRILPSKIGRDLDPLTDKMFGLAVLLGGAIGREIPIWQAASILVTESATGIASIVAKIRHKDPESSKIGKIGMVARCAVITADLVASALGAQTHLAHEILVDGGDGLAVLAAGLGAISCGQLVKRALSK